MPSNVPPWQICVIPMAMTATAQTVRSNEVRSPVAEPIQSNQNGCSDSEPMPSTSFDQATNRVEEEPQQSTSSESSTVIFLIVKKTYTHSFVCIFWRFVIAECLYLAID